MITIKMRDVLQVAKERSAGDEGATLTRDPNPEVSEDEVIEADVLAAVYMKPGNDFFSFVILGPMDREIETKIIEAMDVAQKELVTTILRRKFRKLFGGLGPALKL